ncbi:MAG: hypothetical protein ACC654_09075 [Acidimicrobiia bacterium]
MGSRIWTAAIAVALVSAACSSGGSGAGDPSSGEFSATSEAPSGSAQAAPGGGNPDIRYLGGDLDQAYLQGTWCDSQELTWLFAGASVQIGPDPGALPDAGPIANTINEQAVMLITSSSDEFVIEQLGQRITLTRGPCDGSSAASDAGSPSGGGDFSVLMVANVDELTAGGIFQTLRDAGFDSFVIEGSTSEGFDVYWPGLTADEANNALTEILLVPNVSGGLIYETAQIPSL